MLAKQSKGAAQVMTNIKEPKRHTHNLRNKMVTISNTVAKNHHNGETKYKCNIESKHKHESKQGHGNIKISD